MAESLTAPDGKAIALDDAEKVFRAAMDAPEPNARPDYKPPPKRDPAAPHGRDGAGVPLAPYGVKADGTPRQVPAGPGRPGHKPAARARVQAKASPEPPSGDVTARRAADATTTLELISAGASLLAMLGSSRAVATHQAAELKGDKAKMQAAANAADRFAVLQLDAAACAIHAETVGPSLAQMAQGNRVVAAMVDRLALFNGVASVGIAVMPLVYQVVANHAPPAARDNLPPQLLQLGVLPPGLLMEKLEAQNAVKMAKAQAEILAEKQAAEDQLAELRAA